MITQITAGKHESPFNANPFITNLRSQWMHWPITKIPQTDVLEKQFDLYIFYWNADTTLWIQFWQCLIISVNAWYASLNIYRKMHHKTLMWIKTRPGALQWRHNERNSVSNHQPHDCLLNRLLHRSKKTSKLRVTGLCAGNSPGTSEFPAQRASNTENVDDVIMDGDFSMNEAP